MARRLEDHGREHHSSRNDEGDEGSYHQEDRPLLLLVVVRSVIHSHSQITRCARDAPSFFFALPVVHDYTTLFQRSAGPRQSDWAPDSRYGWRRMALVGHSMVTTTPWLFRVASGSGTHALLRMLCVVDGRQSLQEGRGEAMHRRGHRGTAPRVSRLGTRIHPGTVVHGRLPV